MTNPNIPIEMLPALMRQVYGAQAQQQTPLSLTLPKPYADWQRQLMAGKCRLMVFSMGTKVGKALKTDTPIPTPSGWKTMKDIVVGDLVFDEHGKPVIVEAVSDIMYGRPCVEITFMDKHKIVCDEEHLWLTSTHQERKNQNRKISKGYKTSRENWLPKVRTTKAIMETLSVTIGNKSRFQHAVLNVSQPVEFEKKLLPIDPYLLGVWLGDGSSNSGCITINENDQDIIDSIVKQGRIVKPVKSCPLLHRVGNLTSDLRENNLLNNKHVPEVYLTSSVQDRVSLLRGLMDTDGTIATDGACEFDNTNKQIAFAVAEILVSLGIKCHVNSRIGKIKGVEHKVCYQIQFCTDFPVFLTNRKACRIKSVKSKSRQRIICSIEKVQSVPVKCIRVASNSHLFLCGKGFIPTHNSVAGSVRIARFSFAQPKNQDALYRIIAPTYQLSEITYRYLQRLLPQTLSTQEHLSRDKQLAAQKIWSQFTPDRTPGSLLMQWRHNGARIKCVHGQDPEVTIEGERVHGNVFDEASKMNARVYPSGLSTTSQTGGWNVLYSTPRGKNWFYNLYVECREHMKWATANDKPFEMFAAQARTIDSPYIDQKVIAQAKKTLPDRIFRQLYLAEFLDDGSVFVGYRDCVVGEMIVTLDKIEAWEIPDAKNRSVVIGADWAKRGDYTVMIAIDVTGNRPAIIGFRRTHGMKYMDSVRELVRFGNRFKEVVLVKHDRTGVGDVVDELLQNVEFPIDPVVFTHQSKTHMVDQWSVALASKAVDLCNWDALISEHDHYDVKTNQLGKPIYGAIPGQHDDIVTACFLSWAAYLETQDRNYTVYDLDNLGDDDSSAEPDSIEGYYRSLISDDSDDF